MKNYNKQKYLLVEVAKNKDEIIKNNFIFDGKDYEVDDNIINILDIVYNSREAFYRLGVSSLSLENASQILLAMLKANNNMLQQNKLYAVASIIDIYGKKHIDNNQKYKIVSPIIYFNNKEIGTIERREYINIMKQGKNLQNALNYSLTKKERSLKI